MTFIDLLFYIFCLLMCYQLIIFSYYLLGLFKQKKQHAGDKIPSSVIICAHNELENLKKHLPIVLKQDHERYEVIVVDDRSHDDSYDWLMEKKKEHPHLKVIRIDEVPAHINNKKYALTIGIKAAQYDWLILTDADCYPNSSKWVDIMSSKNRTDHEIALGVSLYEKRKGLLNQFIRFETYQTAALYLSKALKGRAYMAVGRNLAYSKSLFIRNKGFHSIHSITGGDDDLFVNKYANESNHFVVMQQEAVTYSLPKTSWSALFKQKKRHLSVGKYYKMKDKLFLASIQLSTLLAWITAIILLIHAPLLFQSIVLTAMLFRWVGQYVVYYQLSIKFGDKFTPWLLPILEVYYMFMYLVIGSIAIRSKRIQWK